MIQGVLTWWAARMLELVPVRLAAAARRRPGGVTIEALEPLETNDAATVEVVIHRRHDARLGRFRLDDAGTRRLAAAVKGRKRNADTALLLPPEALLDRRVVLPLAAERDPERILGYEMDRLTPFRASEVYWTWQIEDRNQPQGRLALRLWLVPMATLRPLLAALEKAGLVPTMLQSAHPGGPMRRISLLPAAASIGVWRRRGLVAIASACVVLAVAATAGPFIRQAIASRAIDRAISRLHPSLTEVDELRRRIATRAANTDVIGAERVRLGDSLRVLAAVTDILPDDAFLTDFAMHQGRIEMTGQAATAARLIGALAADPALRNPSFAAPVNRLQNGRADIFSIHAEAAP